MTYALIADIHGNLPALEAVLRDARARGAGQFVFLGDDALGLGAPNETLDLLRAQAEAPSVYGNEDEALVHAGKGPEQENEAQFEALYFTAARLSPESRAYLAALPEVWTGAHPGLPTVYAFHKPELYFAGMTPDALNPAFFARSMDQGLFTLEDFPAYAEGMALEDESLQARLATLPTGVYVMGHKHIQWSARLGDHLLVAPGSCGLALDFRPNAAYALLRPEGGTWTVEPRRVDYDLSETLSRLWASPYGREIRVWSRVLARELETGREQAIPFLRFAEDFANGRSDAYRPYRRETWEAAFDAWAGTH